MADVELTNMVMVEDKSTGCALVQERVISWRGLSFPGGHVEPGELCGFRYSGGQGGNGPGYLEPEKLRGYSLVQYLHQ